MIARCALRGASFALFVSFCAPLAFAQQGAAPPSEKSARSKLAEPTRAGPAPEEVKPADVKLEDEAPAADDGGRAAANQDEADTSKGEDDSDEKRNGSPGLEFIKARRAAAKGEAVEREEDEADDAEPVNYRSSSKRDEAPEPDDGLLGTHQDHFFLGIGPRVGFIADEGLDPFSTTDAFSQVAIFGGRTLFTDGDLSLAVVLEWDYGARSATARGLETDIGVHRMTLGAEGRYHLLRRLYGYVKLAPGALHSWAAMSRLETTAWAFAADASLGAAFELFGAKSGETNKPRGWVSLNGGYGFATDAELTLSPAEGENNPERTASVELEPLSMSGPFVGGAVSLSY